MTRVLTITPPLLRDALRATRRKVLSLGDHEHAGVLVPITFSGSSPHLLFTRRTENVETHKGQISFPGGVVEPGDADITSTALREAREEIGIRPGDAEVLGVLDDHATPTGFVITPVVALLQSELSLSPNADEVAEVFQVPLELFSDPSRGRMEMRLVNGKSREVWYYDTGGHIIWGATAAITRSLLRTLGML